MHRRRNSEHADEKHDPHDESDRDAAERRRHGGSETFARDGKRECHQVIDYLGPGHAGRVSRALAPVYLGILDFFGGELSPRSEVLEWSLVAVGVFGFASVFYVAWKDTRDPAWRAAHGLPQSASNTPE